MISQVLSESAIKFDDDSKWVFLEMYLQRAAMVLREHKEEILFSALRKNTI